MHCDNISLNSPYNDKTFQTNAVEKIKNIFYVPYIFSDKHGVYELMWKCNESAER
jgi:hypothetical protein